MSAENIQNRVSDKFPNLESVVAQRMWPTPTAQDTNRTEKAWDAAREKRDGKMFQSLRIQVLKVERMWPTPTAQDSKNNGGPSQWESVPLPLNAEAGGSLNPTWVEWLMGYSPGWTDCED
jgi:hypothetical protein